MVCLETSEDQFPQQDSGDSKVASVLVKQNSQFWETLAELSRSDPEGVADLLELEERDVISWYGKIKAAQVAAQRARAENNSNTMVSTGQMQ
jgi:hypothetical protein